MRQEELFFFLIASATKRLYISVQPLFSGFSVNRGVHSMLRRTQVASWKNRGEVKTENRGGGNFHTSNLNFKKVPPCFNFVSPLFSLITPLAACLPLLRP